MRSLFTPLTGRPSEARPSRKCSRSNCPEIGEGGADCPLSGSGGVAGRISPNRLSLDSPMFMGAVGLVVVVGLLGLDSVIGLVNGVVDLGLVDPLTAVVRALCRAA